MNISIKALTLTLPFLFSCQHALQRQPAGEVLEKKEIKKHFRNLSVEERAAEISRAQVTVQDYDANRIPDIDIVEDLQKRCGPQFQYQLETVTSFPVGDGPSRQSQVYKWPQVSCTYEADDGGLSGMSAKFLCEFPDSQGKKPDVRKVKYAARRSDPLKSEVFESLLATNVARLLGFYTETYCPAEIICTNCPSEDPWSQNRASAPAGSEIHSFPWALVEKPLKAFTITNPGKPAKPQGLQWEELKLVKGDSPEAEKQMRVEREAWMLWIQFLRHWDADPHNQRISCLEVEASETGKSVCQRPIVYTHDYGLSFPRMDLHFWSKEALQSDGSRCQGTLKKGLVGGYPGQGAILEPVISAEARDLLLSRLKKITDKQWTALLQLARVGNVTSTDINEWLRAIRKKISQMEKATCESMDAGNSVLAK